MSQPTTYDAIILGAGAAGLMCAATAGQRGKHILLADHADRPGKKILISGGGRCNFTNLHTAPDRYLSANPHFAKSALSRYTAQDFIDLVDRHGIAWHEKTLGQLFCDGSAKQIVAMLLDECDAGKVEHSLGHAVTAIEHADGLFRVKLGDREVAATALVLATGGPSIPKMGATGFAYDIARKFGLKIVEPRPALVPLTLGAGEAMFTTLSGVATDVVARCGKTGFREAALLTHKGLSGPAILQISSYWRHGEQIGLDFFPDRPSGWLIAAKRDRSAHLPIAALHPLPGRLAYLLLDRLGLPLDCKLGHIPNAELTAAERRLADWRFTPNGTEGYAKAEVTIGGIGTAELSSQTMQAKRVQNLYAIGEAVDVTGWLGGYNFQWAWASGWAVGQSI